MRFIILSDHEASAALARRHSGGQTIRHPSGRPWIVGHWEHDDIVVARAGDRALALLGRTAETSESLTRRLDAVRGVADLDAVARSVPGCYHLIGSIGGVTRAQGSLSYRYQLFTGTVDRVAVAADRADTIAAMTGAGIDSEAVVLQLVAPFGPPWPLRERCVWQGVEQVPGGRFLVLRGDDPVARTCRWWTPPEPELSLADGAQVVRTALVAAVAARVPRGGGSLSADLSGGLDSTSLCFIAAAAGADPTTFRFAPLDESNEDERWAEWCEEQLPGKHLVVPGDEAPSWYEVTGDDDVEGPFPFVRTRALAGFIAAHVGAHGSRRHLQGIGGDELFSASTLTLHDLARRHPTTAARQILTTKAMRRWSVATTTRFLLSGVPYHRWLARSGRRLTAPPGEMTHANWEIATTLPPWITADAADVARRLYREAAASRPRPEATPPAQHEMIRITQFNGAAARRSSRVAERDSVTLENPYLDDHVLNAALSVRFADRMVSGRFKPVLGEAMRGIIPDGLLDRRTKGDYSAEQFAGLRRHRGDLLALFDDAELARMGLIDTDRLRADVFGVLPNSKPLIPFERTLSCEAWLRDVARAA
ncbi:asparagine synthase-related protein [Micromonospora sp. NPDC023888]|uniref:asparagine synthase-related protein n=1 Tax=Micromonospora sp. NPDC023888 TaxID=3155607 RepID=UPI0033FD78E1